MPLLVTSAAGVNGDGFGALLEFDIKGKPLGLFSNDGRISDPRGLGVNREERLLFLNSGADRVLALDQRGPVIRDSGPIEDLNPGGGNFGPDGRYYVGLRSAGTIPAFTTSLDASPEWVLPKRVVPFPRGFAFGHDGKLFLASGIGPRGKVTIQSLRLVRTATYCRIGASKIPASALSIWPSHRTATYWFRANIPSARPMP